MGSLIKGGITLDRKILAELAVRQPEAFTAIVKAATK
jgi:ribosomal protein L20